MGGVRAGPARSQGGWSPGSRPGRIADPVHLFEASDEEMLDLLIGSATAPSAEELAERRAWRTTATSDMAPKRIGRPAAAPPLRPGCHQPYDAWEQRSSTAAAERRSGYEPAGSSDVGVAARSRGPGGVRRQGSGPGPGYFGGPAGSAWNRSYLRAGRGHRGEGRSRGRGHQRTSFRQTKNVKSPRPKGRGKNAPGHGSSAPWAEPQWRPSPSLSSPIRRLWS